MSRFVTYIAIITLCIVWWPRPVHSQTSSAASTARQTPPTLGFLTSYRFHLNASRLLSSDSNFVWDADFGADMDVFDLEYVRGNVLVNYEGIVGQQIRAIDPNQGNYTIDLSVWWRTGESDGELGATFHHVSRHLSDRDNEFAISWNMVGFQSAFSRVFRSWNLDIAYRVLGTIQRAYVDYTAELGGSVQGLRPVHPRASLIAAAEVTIVAVDRSERGRKHQLGGRFEIGLRFPGGDGAGEVFLAQEHRIDANPFDLEPTTFWSRPPSRC